MSNVVLDALKPHATAFYAIAGERGYQDAKWGTIQQHPHTVGEWLLIVEGELEEAKQAWRTGHGDEAALAELIQVAAVAVACLSQHDIPDQTERIGPRR